VVDRAEYQLQCLSCNIQVETPHNPGTHAACADDQGCMRVGAVPAAAFSYTCDYDATARAR
jgi:hypothetical protein